MLLVFGSINIDLVFRVDTLPGPGDTVLAPGYVAVPGGKGANHAVAAARDGARVRMVGRVGRDAFARRNGRISSIDAPVVPIRFASTAPIARKTVLTAGVPANSPLM